MGKVLKRGVFGLAEGGYFGYFLGYGFSCIESGKHLKSGVFGLKRVIQIKFSLNFHVKGVDFRGKWCKNG